MGAQKVNRLLHSLCVLLQVIFFDKLKRKCSLHKLTFAMGNRSNGVFFFLGLFDMLVPCKISFS